MMIARWRIDARFGHKQQALDLMQKWMREIGISIGWTTINTRLLTGSIGTPESTIESEIQINDLTELDEAWDKLAQSDAHKDWGKELEPYIVSGSARWEILRVL